MICLLTEHDLPIAVADLIGPPGSNISKGYQCARTKATCILNRVIKPELQNDVIAQMKESGYSICKNDSNNQNLEKMNTVTVSCY